MIRFPSRPEDVLAAHCREHGAAAAIADLRGAGYIIVRHDAIRLAQAHARADNDNEPALAVN